MRPPPAVGVDDDLASGEAGVALGTADDELPRGVEVDVAVVAVVDGEGALTVLKCDGFMRSGLVEGEVGDICVCVSQNVQSRLIW